MYIGAHVSTAGGIDTGVGRGVAIGAEAIQIFGGPPQTYRASNYSNDQTENFKRKAAEAGLGPTWFHGIYLINLASATPETVQKSIESLVSYMELCARINGAGVLFHTGSHKGLGFAQVKEQVVDTLNTILDQSPSEILLALENAAGQGGAIGSKVSELGELIRMVNNNRLRVCIDTQHAFAAGYNVATLEGMDQLMTEFDQAIGLDRLAVMHVNDSKTPLGSGIDRHANIGQGEIGLTGFKTILAHPAVRNVPMYLEIPGDDGKSGPDTANIERLKQIRQEVMK